MHYEFLNEDGSVLNDEFGYVIKEIMVPTQMRIALYKNGEPRSQEELTKYGITVKSYTDEEWTAKIFAKYYQENPNLKLAVEKYVALFEGTGVSPTADSETIKENIKDVELQGNILAAMHDIELNYEIVTGHGLEAYYNLDNLIKNLPKD